MAASIKFADDAAQSTDDAAQSTDALDRNVADRDQNPRNAAISADEAAQTAGASTARCAQADVDAHRDPRTRDGLSPVMSPRDVQILAHRLTFLTRRSAHEMLRLSRSSLGLEPAA